MEPAGAGHGVSEGREAPIPEGQREEGGGTQNGAE